MSKGGLPTKFYPHHRIPFAIDSERGGHFDIGVLELGHILLPGFRVKLDKDRAQHGRIIEPCLGVIIDVFRGNLWSGCAALRLASSGASSRRSSLAATTLNCFQGFLTFGYIQISVFICIIFFGEFLFRPIRPHSSRSPRARSASWKIRSQFLKGQLAVLV